MPRPGTILNADLVKELPRLFGYERLKLFRRNVALVKSEGRVFRCGIPGQADVYGFVAVNVSGKKLAVPVEIEGKIPPDKPSKEQLSWGGMVAGIGGIFIVARSVEQALAELQYHVARLEKDEESGVSADLLNTPKQKDL